MTDAPGGRRFCTTCGESLSGNWRFCPSCGTAKAVPVIAPEPDRQPVASVVLPDGTRHSGQAQFDAALSQLNDGIDCDAGNIDLRLQRAQLLSSVGLYAPALSDISTARRCLDPRDIAGLLRVQELDRLLRERARGSFVRQSSLPRMPAWLRPLLRRSASLSPDSQ